MRFDIGFAIRCLGKKRLENVTLHGTPTKLEQATIIGAIRVPQNTGVGAANDEGYPT